MKLLLPEQNEELRSLVPALAAMPDAESACRLLVARVAVILDAPGLLLERERAGRWRVVAAARMAVPPETLVNSARQALATLADAASAVVDVTLENDRWTCVSLRGGAATERVLVVSGDWTLSRPLLEDLAMSVGGALRLLPSRRRPARRELIAAYTLPRRLAYLA